jgi:NAD(P)H-hydrate epimerase
MILLNASESRELDRLTQTKCGVPSYTLMTRAGDEVARAVTRHWADRLHLGVTIVAGKGNNGGDGLVAARRLHQDGIRVRVLLLARTTDLKGDAGRAWSDFAEVDGTLVENAIADHLNGETGIIVDAIFGTGLNAEIAGEHGRMITAINESRLPVVAVDIASGINADTGAIMGKAVKAALTVTFGYAKYGHVSYPGAEYCGALEVADIGFAAASVDEIAPAGRLIEADDAARLLPARRENSHKGTYGHLLIVAGSRGKSGAVLLASRGALHSGAGLVTAAVPESILGIVAAGQAELMTEPLPDHDGRFSAEPTIEGLRELIQGKSALAVGPGIGVNNDTIELISWLIAEAIQPECPMLLDADGLNALAQLGPEKLQSAQGPVILTPHPGEMARLLKISTIDVNRDRVSAARRLADLTGAVVLLKGARSVVVAGDVVTINNSGNPGMATAGMGDVLSGIVGALLGQGLRPGAALQLGVFVHGDAADRIAARGIRFGYLAGELAAELPATFSALA